MKLSKIIDELTELKEYIGDKDLEACTANDAMTGVNIMYLNDEGGWTSTSLEGEKAKAELKATMGDQESHDKIKVKVLHLDFCDGSNDPDLVAMADVEVMNDTSVLAVNRLGLRYNDTTREYSIVAPKTLSGGVGMNEFTCRAVTSAVAARYEQIKHSDEMLEKLATATSIDRKEYGEILPAISAHFDRDDMDCPDCLEECQLQLKAAYAYINYLENAQLRVTKVDVVPCSMKDDPSRLADVVAVINDGLVIRGIRLYAAAPAMSPMFGKDGVYLSYPELVGSKIYPAAYPIQPTSDGNLQSQLLDKVIERYKSMSVARTLSLSWNNILQAGNKYLVKFRPSGHPHVSMLRNLVNNSAICECVMENDQPDVKNADGTPYIPEKALIVKYTITPDMTLKDVPYYAIPECEWGQSIDLAAPTRDGLLYLKPCELTKNMTENTSTCCIEAQPERPVSFIDHTPVEAKEPTMEHSVYSRLEADKYMDWQANRIKQLEEALRQERDRFQPSGWSKAFTEMFESSITSAVNDGLAKIETACVSALDKFCRQMDPSAYDGQ
jgi:DNA-binding protein YbaB